MDELNEQIGNMMSESLIFVTGRPSYCVIDVKANLVLFGSTQLKFS